MNYKLGCNWGAGAPDFYGFLIANDVVIGYNGIADYKKGDIVILFKGFNAVAIAMVNDDAKPVTDYPELKQSFEDYEIDYSDKVLIAKALIKPIIESERFTYSNRRGICRINSEKINTIIDNIKTKSFNELL